MGSSTGVVFIALFPLSDTCIRLTYFMKIRSGIELRVEAVECVPSCSMATRAVYFLWFSVVVDS